MTSKTNDPVFIINGLKSNSENVILNCRIVSEKNTLFQLFYKKTNTSEYNEKDSFRTKIRKGLNEFNLLIPSNFINNKIRVDLVNNAGTYNIKDFIIYGIK